MIKFKNIIHIAVIVSIVLFSGCTGEEDKKVTETPEPTPADTNPAQTTIVQTTASRTPQAPYHVQVTEIKTLYDCISSPYSSEIKPCTLINLQVKNNINSLDFKIVREDIITKDSKVLPAVYDTEVGLSDQCTRQAGMKFVLTENAHINVALCHPTINNADKPRLHLAAIINGERKEFEFDLTQ